MTKEYQRARYLKNKEKILAYQKDYYENNKEARLDYAKSYYQENHDSILESQKEYQHQNREAVSDYYKTYVRSRQKDDPDFKLRRGISTTIHLALKSANGSKRGASIMDYLPYTIQELRSHIESQFEPWMNWGNHGIYKAKFYRENDSSTWTWNIDHIIPRSKLPYSSMEDDNFKKCWALSNLRPLLSKLNLEKGDK